MTITIAITSQLHCNYHFELFRLYFAQLCLRENNNCRTGSQESNICNYKLIKLERKPLQRRVSRASRCLILVWIVARVNTVKT